MAQFRWGVLPLRAETGRFVGEQVGERICKLCDQACIEDVIHFLLNCFCYKNLSEYELGTVLNYLHISNKCDDDKLSTLLNKYVRRKAFVLLKAFLLRRRILYN